MLAEVYQAALMANEVLSSHLQMGFDCVCRHSSRRLQSCHQAEVEDRQLLLLLLLLLLQAQDNGKLLEVS